MSATPHLTGGVPDGTEAISSVQTLSRELHQRRRPGRARATTTSTCAGVTYSTATYIGTSEHQLLRDAVRLRRPAAGRTDVQTPTGTITRTVYDGLGRVVSTWVGTNDTPASGDWSPTNNTGPANMVEVTADVYDGGGVGDGNLTQETALPRRQRRQPRDRVLLRLARPAGGDQGRRAGAARTRRTHRPIIYTTYDNLDEVTEVQQYDGDGVTHQQQRRRAGGAVVVSLLRAQTVDQLRRPGPRLPDAGLRRRPVAAAASRPTP